MNAERALELCDVFAGARLTPDVLTPNDITHSACVSACEVHVDAESALELFVVLTPNGITHTASVGTCEEQVNAESAPELHDVLQRQWPSPNVTTYSASISACEKHVNAERAWGSWTCRLLPRGQAVTYAVEWDVRREKYCCSSCTGFKTGRCGSVDGRASSRRRRDRC